MKPAELQTLLERIEDTQKQEIQKKYGEKPIFLSDVHRQRIERAIGHNVSTPEELVLRIERAFSVSVADITVPLPPFLLERLKTRAIRVEWETFVPMIITKLLRQYVGIS